jgi:hypothetical protein
MMFRVFIAFALATVAMAFAPMSRFGKMNAVSTKTSLAMSAKVGDLVPQVVFKARVRDESIPGPNPFKWKDVTSNDLFKGKRVVIFALPGAYTPTCSTTHLPGYETKYGKRNFYLLIDFCS